jgi:hypothetical protein
MPILVTNDVELSEEEEEEDYQAAPEELMMEDEDIFMGQDLPTRYFFFLTLPYPTWGQK